MNYKRLFDVINLTILVVTLILSVYLIVKYFYAKDEITKTALELGYFGIFIFSLILEVSLQLIGPDIFLLAGIMAGFNFYYVLSFVCLGSIIGGFIAYYLGWIYGRRALNLFIKDNNFEKACELFEKYGKLSMAITALTPLPYFPMVAGIFKMRMKDFLLYSVFTRMVRFIATAYVILWVFKT